MSDLLVESTSLRPLPFEPSFEQIPDDESQTSEELAEALRSIMETMLKDNGHATRNVHAKAHGLLRGRIAVLENLPVE
ncbi:catalase, partial [Pseudomonas sp. NPDC096950]